MYYLQREEHVLIARGVNSIVQAMKKKDESEPTIVLASQIKFWREEFEGKEAVINQRMCELEKRAKKLEEATN